MGPVKRMVRKEELNLNRGMESEFLAPVRCEFRV